MKKLFAAMLCAMLVLFAAGAPAEGTEMSFTINNQLDISVVVPEHYRFDEEWFQGVLYATLVPDADELPSMLLSMGGSEAYADKSINDLTAQELDELIAISIGDFANPTYAISETAYGTKLIIVDENSDADEYVEIFTLYQGYFVSVMVEPNGQRQLTADEIQLAVEFLSNMEFVGMDL